jgi:hypothetical protein
MRIITISPRTRLGSLLLGLAVLGAGVALVLVGFAVLAGLVIGGTLLATGAAIYYKLRAFAHPTLGSPEQPRAELDPAQEVFSDDSRALPPSSRDRER